MKNIHLIKTDKPSRLHLDKTKYLSYDLGFYSKDNKSFGSYQNIYITSNEEIKEGDYFWKPDCNMIFRAEYTPHKGCQKVILTTDQDLIKDGVQSIDDEFLQWFVKNPSCEEVEIESWQTKGEWDLDYKIIIPKEEHKITNCGNKNCQSGVINGKNPKLCKKCNPKEEPKQELIIYLDDIRTPIDPEWIVVRNYEEFVNRITEIGLHNIALISLDHDLGPSAMREWYTNVYHNYTLDYNNITEKTGMDCTKWLVEQWLDGAPVCKVMIHSANAIGASNMMGYINNYKHIHRLEQDCVRWEVPHTV